MFSNNNTSFYPVSELPRHKKSIFYFLSSLHISEKCLLKHRVLEINHL